MHYRTLVYIQMNKKYDMNFKCEISLSYIAAVIY